MSAFTLRNRLISARLPRRLVLVNIALLLGIFLTLASGLLGGTFPISAGDVFAALAGQAEGPVEMIVMQSRLPRLLTALGVGLAFGLAGEMVQTLLRNPLASPDIVGFTAGAGLGAVLSVALTGATLFVLPGALLGGLCAALLLLALSWRQGLSPGAVVLVGIGLTITLGVVTDLFMVRLDAENVGELVKWIVGSLNARSWAEVSLIWVALVVLFPCALLLQPALARLSFADNIARALGSRLMLVRLAVLLLAVALVAAGVAVAGPLPFVAFVAGPIAHGLNGAGRPTLASAALSGGLVTLLADKAAQSLPAVLSLPTGIFTSLIGAPVLIWILYVQAKRQRQ